MTTKETIVEVRQMLERVPNVTAQLTRSRNPFELRYFVIGKHEDRVQQYKQAVIEMEAKYNALRESYFKKAETQIDREELSEKLDAETSDHERRRLEIKLARLDFEEKQGDQAMLGGVKEILDFLTIIEGEYADLLDMTEEQLLLTEGEYWKTRFAKQVHIDLMTVGKITAGNLCALEQMPKDTQREVLKLAMVRDNEVNQLFLEAESEGKKLLAESRTQPAMLNAVSSELPVKLRKDAPPGYPEDKIMEIDRCEIVIATMHRPGEEHLGVPQLYIPTGKNYSVLQRMCPSAEQIGEYRNKLILDALSIGATHILFVDDDLEVDADALQRLYAHDLDVVGGWYPKKTPVVESATITATPDGKSRMPVPKDATGLVQIKGSLSAGLTLIKTRVFDKIKYPWFLTTTRGTEDTYFCDRLNEAGIDYWLDADVKATHVDRATGKKYHITEGVT